MIQVVVTMIIKEGKMELFLTECRKLRPLVLAEKGCFGYEYFREVSSPLGNQESVQNNRITLLERWGILRRVENTLFYAAYERISRSCKGSTGKCIFPRTRAGFLNQLHPMSFLSSNY
jgi:hypothetical protein